MVAAPGSLSLEQEIQQLKKRLDVQARAPDVFPVCRVRFNGSVGMDAGDTFAQGGWTRFEDPTGLYGMDGTLSRIVPKVTGYYCIQFHSSQTGPTTGFAAARVTVNSPHVGASIAADTCNYPSDASADGAVCDAIRLRVKLNAGDSLYWATYTTDPATLHGLALGVPTEILVQYANARSA